MLGTHPGSQPVLLGVREASSWMVIECCIGCVAAISESWMAIVAVQESYVELLQRTKVLDKQGTISPDQWEVRGEEK